jgi:ketosteroid isomerase-like protein
VSITTEQRASETEIRTLIESWAAAVHAADLDGVLADHSDDIQMFDVPPPNEVRGIEAYRKTWPPFFEWQKRGAAFEIVSSTSPRVPMWPSRPPCSAAGLRRS